MKDWRDEGQVRCRTGSMQDRRDEEQWHAGQEGQITMGCRTGGIQYRGDEGQERFWTVDRKHAGHWKVCQNSHQKIISKLK